MCLTCCSPCPGQYLDAIKKPTNALKREGIIVSDSHIRCLAKVLEDFLEKWFWCFRPLVEIQNTIDFPIAAVPVFSEVCGANDETC